MKIFSALCFVLLLCPLFAHADETVIRYSGNQPLSERWKWGLQQGSNQKDGFWIAYSFDRLMYQNESIGTWYGDHQKRTTLQEIIEGRSMPVPPHISGRGSLITKQLAILFEYRPGGSIRSIETSNLELSLELHRHPLIWLGNVEVQDSLKWLAPMYKQISNEDLTENLIAAIGVHKTPEIIPVLKSILSDPSENVRAQAAFWLGNLGDQKAFAVLNDFLQNERSEDVLDEAMAGMNEAESPVATEMLNSWAEKNDNIELRKKAIFWLAQKAAHNVQQKIKEIAFKDPDTQVEKQAVIALSEMEDSAGVPQLIEIAKSHPNPEIRKTAIIFLGEAGDPRARQALLDIVRQN